MPSNRMEPEFIGAIRIIMSGVKQIGNIYGFAHKHNSMPGRVYDPSGLSPTLRTPSGGGQRADN